MDIKTIILVIIFIGVLIFIYLQFSSIRQEISKLAISTKNMLNENSIILKKQFQSQLDNNLEKIKLINSDSIQQVRKMSIIHNEPIKRSSDCYTENDSECEIGQAIKYLSDSTYDGKNNIGNDFYMSQDDKLSKTSPINVNNQVDPKNIASVVDNISKNVTDHLLFVVNSFDKPHSSNVENKNMIYRQSIKNMLIDEDEYDNPENEKTLSQNIIDVDENIIDESDNDFDEDNIDDDNSESYDDSEDKEIIEINTKDLINEINNDQKTNSEKKISNSGNSEEKNKELNEENKVDNISIGSNKKYDKNSKLDSENENDESSVLTSEIITINKKSFKNLKNYKMDALKKIAKYHKIPLSIKENGKYRTYNKSELYNKIKELLENK